MPFILVLCGLLLSSAFLKRCEDNISSTCTTWYLRSLPLFLLHRTHSVFQASPSFFSHSSRPQCRRWYSYRQPVWNLYVKKKLPAFKCRGFDAFGNAFRDGGISALADTDKTPETRPDLGLQSAEINQSVTSRHLVLTQVFGIHRRPPVLLCSSSRLRYRTFKFCSAPSRPDIKQSQWGFII